MSGRKPMGPQLVQHLSGSQYAKERLEVILETVAGNLTVSTACERLGIGEARFHRLRMEVLQVGLTNLEPRSAGRPRHEVSDSEREKEQLRAQVEALEDELKMAAVRQELATILAPANLSSDPAARSALKKTTRDKNQARRNQRRKLKRRH